eukprot:m.669431 g.669431  ORF g.669431 m.669431 type:complete len:56 (+) comp22762_c1_seq18:76-243(+)
MYAHLQHQWDTFKYTHEHERHMEHCTYHPLFMKNICVSNHVPVETTYNMHNLTHP